MDYSLLIGLHFREDCSNNERGLSPTGTLLTFLHVLVFSELLILILLLTKLDLCSVQVEEEHIMIKVRLWGTRYFRRSQTV